MWPGDLQRAQASGVGVGQFGDWEGERLRECHKIHDLRVQCLLQCSIGPLRYKVAIFNPSLS